MTTKQIDEIYRVTPEYPAYDGFMTHGVGLAMWEIIEKHFEDIGLASIDITNKKVYSLLKLNYYRNYLSLRKK